jgi:hypothetical protein
MTDDKDASFVATDARRFQNFARALVNVPRAELSEIIEAEKVAKKDLAICDASRKSSSL